MSDKFGFDALVDRRSVPALKVHTAVLGEDGADLFAGGVADMDFRVAPPIRDALATRLEHAVFGYEAVPTKLLDSLTNWLGHRHDWIVASEHILRAPNVLNSLAIAVSAFSREGDGIIVQPPTFFDFFDIVRENDRRLVNNPLVLTEGRYEMDFAGLERLASDPKNTILLLCNPHNPIGRVWTRSELARLGVICRANDVLIVSDEIHGDITFPGHTYTPVASLSAEDAQNSITCLSPAKSFNIASCCSAFTLVPDDNKRAIFQAENSRLTANKNNAFASAAMEAAYREGGPWLDAVLEYIQGNLAMLRDRFDALDHVDLIEPEGTFLVWLDFRRLGFEPTELTRFLRKQARWAITRGEAFGDAGAGFGRLNIACRRAELSLALDRLEAALQGYASENSSRD